MEDQPDEHGYRLGDHLKVKFAYLPLPFSPTFRHHGIYVGSGRVIHASKKKGRVKECSLDTFEDGSEGDIKVVDSKLCFSREQVVANARSKVGKIYDLGKFNCEHFARSCRSGDKKSKQVNSAKMTVGKIAGGLAAAVGAIGLAKLASSSRSVRQSGGDSDD